MEVFELRYGPGEYGRGEYRVFPLIGDRYWSRLEVAKSNFPRVEGTVEAESWLAAKKALGYPLTSLQSRILADQASYFELFGRFGPSIGRNVEAREARKPIGEPSPHFEGETV